MASSKFLPGCLVSMVAVAVFYASWVSFPSVESAADIDQALEHQRQAFEADQKLAKNPAQNAFVDPDLSQFWGRKSVEYRDKSAPSQVASAMRAFGFLGGEQATPVGELVKKQDPALRKALSDFEKLQPTLRRALSCPTYVLPQANPPDMESEPGNLLAHRIISQALSAYAEVQLAEGKTSLALAATEEIFQFSHLLVAQRSHSLINVMIACAVQTTAQETLGYVLQSAQIRPEQLRPWLKVLSSTPFTPEMSVDAVEFELWVARNTFEHPSKSLPTGKLALLPGVWQREWRLFQNDYAPALRAARSQQAGNLAWTGQFGLHTWILGQHSWLTALLMPNYDRVFKMLELGRRRQDFLRLYVQVLLERPTELKSQWLGSLNPKSLTYRLEKDGPHLNYDLEPQLVTNLPSPQPGPARWQSLMQPHWALPVGP